MTIKEKETESQNICMICQESKGILVKPCTCSYYHQECLHEWLTVSRNLVCPSCKQDLSIKRYREFVYCYSFMKESVSEYYTPLIKNVLYWLYCMIWMTPLILMYYSLIILLANSENIQEYTSILNTLCTGSGLIRLLKHSGFYIIITYGAFNLVYIIDTIFL